MPKRYTSWGYEPKDKQAAYIPAWRHATHITAQQQSFLPFGNGRSYGDSCLNNRGQIIDTHRLDHFIEFNRDNGLITCESGVTFSEIIKVCTPAGWFVPVSPGTRFITLGGAIANDVHGKNHHGQGTFGRHVVRFELMRTDGSSVICSTTENYALFKATIGGLGMTGLITWAQFQLIPITSDRINVRRISFNNLNEFYELSSTYSESCDYTVAWLDCSSRGKAFGRGIFFTGDHHEASTICQTIDFELPNPLLSIPFYLPAKTLNKYSVRTFNALYFNKNKKQRKYQDTMRHFFYPLDSIDGWNKVYGRKGFYQFQFCVPINQRQELEKILTIVAKSGSASFLTVLKEFGEAVSPGMLSFPMPGYCLALDFPDHGQATTTLLSKLNQIVMAAGGRVYPAKDRLMNAESFESSYPLIDEYKNHIDPGMSSDFWRRVMRDE